MVFNKRKADRRKLDAPVLSGAAEVCETRALLSADGVCLPVADGDAVVIEDIEATDSEEAVGSGEVSEEFEFIPELAICTMVPLETGEVFGESGAAADGEEVATEELVDPSLMFYSFAAVDGGEEALAEDFEVAAGEIAVDDSVVADETPVYKGDVEESSLVADDGTVRVQFWHDLAPGAEEDVVVEDSDGNVDVTTLEDYDPSWSYRSFVVDVPVDDSEVVDETGAREDVVIDETDLNVDVTTLEDYDPSWAYRNFLADVPDAEGEAVDGVTDGEVKVQFWHDLAPGAGEDVVVDELEGNADISTLEDFDPSWAYRGNVVDGEKEVVEDGEVVVVDDEIVSDGEVVVEDDSEIPIRYYFGMNFRGDSGGEIPVDVLAMASGTPSTTSAPAVMGPVADAAPVATPAVSIPVVSQPASVPLAPASPLAIPVIGNGVNSLFTEEEELVVTSLAPLVAESNPLSSGIDESLASDLSSELGDSIRSSGEESDSTIGELTPLLGEEQEEEEAVEVPSVEELPVETEEAVSVSDVPQPAVVVARANYGRSIDEVMSEFAMSGFAG